MLKVEENLEGLDGVDRVTSTAAASLGTLNVELTEAADADATLSLVKNAVDKINNFPRGVEPPVVEKRDVKDLAIAFAITGDLSLQQKKDYADEIEKDLLNKAGISDVMLSGAPEQEIEITVSETDLRAFELSFDQVARAVAGTNLETFGGEIKTSGRNINVKADDKGYYARDLANLIVASAPSGGTGLPP